MKTIGLLNFAVAIGMICTMILCNLNTGAYVTGIPILILNLVAGTYTIKEGVK